MILDSKQQQNQLMDKLHKVQISGPYHEVLPQVVETQDLIQAVAAAEIKMPGMPAPGGQVPDQEESPDESASPEKTGRSSGPPKAVGKGMAEKSK